MKEGLNSCLLATGASSNERVKLSRATHVLTTVCVTTLIGNEYV